MILSRTAVTLNQPPSMPAACASTVSPTPRPPFVSTRGDAWNAGAEAGLHASDLLVALDDTPMQRMSPGMVQEALTRDGHESSLLIQRADEVFPVRLKLRRLL
jgi:hypothetical protein